VKSYLLFLFVFFIQTSFAGDSKGNGGNALVCLDENSKNHLLALDHYEAIINYGADIPGDESMEELELALNLIDRLESLGRHRYQRMRLAAQNFYNYVKWVDFPLGKIEDIGNYSIPFDCKLYQVVNQNRKILPRDKKYLIEKNIWSKLSKRDRAVLIIHEILYFEAPGKTSEAIREFNSFLIADKLRDFTSMEYISFLKNHGFQNHTYNGFEITLNNDQITYYKTGEVRTSRTINHSLALFKGIELSMNKSPIKFSKKGQPLEFCSFTPIPHDFGFGSQDVRCINFIGEYWPLAFFNDGTLKSGTVNTFEASGDGYKIAFGKLSETMNYYSPLWFNSDGSLNKARNTVINFKHLLQTWKIGGKEDTFFDAKLNILQTRVLKKEIFESLYGGILIKGTLKFSGKNLVEGFAAVPFDLSILGQNYFFKGNQKIEFYENGGLKSAETILGEHLEFSRDGLRI
jgi:hypothetical protein